MSTIVNQNLKRAYDLVQREDYAIAWPIASEALNENPDSVQALYLCGWILRSQGHVGMALQFFRRAIGLDHKIPNLWMHYAACLHDCNKYEEAREAFMYVHKAMPHDAQALANIAATYVQEGKCAKAVEYADRALILDNDNRNARVVKAFGCLGLGRWEEGWQCVDALYGGQLTIRVYNDPEHEEPLWDGSPGKTVVVQADQGLGDIIMFSQCLPQMIADCKQVILDCSSRLAPLFRRNFPGLIVYETLDEHEKPLEWPKQYQIDAHTHISYLGKFYRKRDEDFPRKAYLTPDAALTEQWQNELAAYPKPWIGIAWLGGIQRTNQAARSMKLEELAPIMEHGGTFVSLAYQDVGLEVARWNIDHKTQVYCPDLRNEGSYDRTLSLIAALDHVVTVPTTVVHACGAIGKRCSMLVHQAPAWGHVYGGDGMLWYPESSVHNYRQHEGEIGWTEAVKRLAASYEAFILPLARAA